MKKKVGMVSAIIALVFILGAVALRVLVKPNDLRDLALQRARASSGYAIEAGPADLKFSFSGMGIRVNSLSLISPENSRDLQVEQVDLYVKLLPLLKKKVELAEVVLHRPTFVFTPLPPSHETARSESGEAPLAFLAMESWKIVEGRYRQTGDWGELDLQGLNLDGGFTWDAAAGGKGNAQGTSSGGTLTRSTGAMPLPAAEFEAGFALSPAGDVFRLPRVTLKSGAVQLALSGQYRLASEGWSGEMSGGMDPTAWTAVAGLLPQTQQDRLQPYGVSGTVSLPEMTLRHEAAPPGNTVLGRAEFTDVSLSYPGAPLGVSRAQGTVRFSPEGLQLADGVAWLGEDKLMLSGALTGENRDQLRAAVRGAIRGTTLAQILPKDMPLTFADGNVHLDLNLSQVLPNAGLPNVDGTLRLEGLTGIVRELPLREGAGLVRFSGKGAQVEGLSARLGSSDFRVDGAVSDLSNPDFRYRLVSNRLDFNELFPAGDKEDPTKTEAGGSAIGIPGTGTLDVANLRYRRLEFTGFRSQMHMGLDGLSLRDVRANLAGGEVTGHANVTPLADGGQWKYEGQLHAANMNAGQLLNEWTRAGALLSGTLSGDIDLSGLAGESFDFRKGLTLDGELKVRDGAIANLPGVGVLRESFKLPAGPGGTWPFDRARVEFAVRDGKVVLDTMYVSQSGLAWSMQGSADLTGALDMHGTLRADPKKITLPPQVAMFAPYLAEADGRIPIDFTVGGTLEKPVPGLDWAGLTRRAQAKAVAEEKQTLEETVKDKVKDPALNALKKKLLGGSGSSPR